MEKNNLIFRTSYAGDMAVAWEAISSLKTDMPIEVVVGDTMTAKGTVAPTENGKLSLDANQGLEPLTIDIARIQRINPPAKPAVKVTGRINAGMDIKKGNTDTKAYHVDGLVVARTERNRYTLGIETNQEEESDQKTADNALLYMSYDHFVTPKWFLYGNGNFEKDKFKDLNLRTTVGFGSGYQFFEEERRNLSVRGGLAYVNEDYDVEGQDRDYTAGRWAVAFDQYFFDKFVQLFHGHEGVVSLEDTQDMFVRTRTGLRFPLKKGFNTTAQYNWDWENTPAPGRDRVDERYLFTLGYSWE
jgi:putative salt-induced outer membrane protein YdiY